MAKPVDYGNPDVYLIQQDGFYVIDYNKFEAIALRKVPKDMCILPLKIIARHKELSKKYARQKSVQNYKPSPCSSSKESLHKSFVTHHIDAIPFPSDYYKSLTPCTKKISYKFNAKKYIPLMQRKIFEISGKRLPMFTVDCYSDSHNAQCAKYVTKKQDWHSIATDSILFWPLEVGHMNPPFMVDVIKKGVTCARRREMRAYLIMPYAQKWKKTIEWCGKYSTVFETIAPGNDLFQGAMDDYAEFLPPMKWGVIIFYFDFGVK